MRAKSPDVSESRDTIKRAISETSNKRRVGTLDLNFCYLVLSRPLFCKINEGYLQIVNISNTFHKHFHKYRLGHLIYFFPSRLKVVPMWSRSWMRDTWLCTKYTAVRNVRSLRASGTAEWLTEIEWTPDDWNIETSAGWKRKLTRVWSGQIYYWIHLQRPWPCCHINPIRSVGWASRIF